MPVSDLKFRFWGKKNFKKNEIRRYFDAFICVPVLEFKCRFWAVKCRFWAVKCQFWRKIISKKKLKFLDTFDFFI